MTTLQGQVAVVTGAGRGIGRAIALGFARAGAAVVCSARSKAQIDDTAARIEEAGGRAISVVADVVSYPAVEALFAEAGRAFGGVDIALVNAGASPQNLPVADSDPLLWQQTVEVNLIGAYHTARAAIVPLRRRGGGKILFVGSGMGHRSSPTRTAYASSKAGVNMLMRVLAQELIADHICVNELVPGPVLTEFVAGRVDALRAATGGHEWFKQADDVVPLALFVATQPPDGPTGQTFSLARREL
ncbi:MAG TPA: SDR family oxidoreductase [Burkholderiaceae bacterium]|nr:SDR family oxidoreductase [Burkholderiaceae bacterium]